MDKYLIIIILKGIDPRSFSTHKNELCIKKTMYYFTDISNFEPEFESTDHVIIYYQNLIGDQQYGFLPNRSCVTQMTYVIDDIATTINRHNDVDIVYFDFAKAFDSVKHDIILKKLKYLYNIDGLMLNFIRAYLQDRYQRVVINGTSSSNLSVTSGVPQGSILGPLLFVLFIEDIYSHVSDGTKIALYADDTKIWREIKTENDCFILNQDIAALQQWAEENCMKFHPDKCKVLTITLRHQKFNILPFDRFSYELGNCILDYVDEEKNLGVIITNKLNWDTQQDTIVSKANKQLGLLMRTCHL